jgi:hypothetical protein
MTEYDNWTRIEKQKQEKARQLAKMKFTRDNERLLKNIRTNSTKPQGGKE